MTSPLHTKLKELRDFDRDAVNNDFFDEKDYLCRNDCAYSFVNGASYQHRKQLTLISALEMATEALEFYTAENADFAAGLEMPVPCSKEDVVRVGTKAKQTLAEIAEMLVGK